MAGANNAQMKAAGWKARDITKARAERGKLSHDAMRASGFAPKKGFEPATRAKPAAKAESGAPAGWKAAARGEGGDARRAATAARGDYLRGQAAAAGQAKRADLAGRGARDLGASMLAGRKAAAATERSERAAGAAAMLAKNKAAAGKARRGELAGRGLRDVAGAMMARRKATAKPSLSRAMDNFRSQAHAAMDRYYTGSSKPRLEFQEGDKYIRVVRNDGVSKSAHSFIEKAKRDVFKPDGWKRPAKGARGNIYRGVELTDMGSVKYTDRYNHQVAKGFADRAAWIRKKAAGG